MKNINLLKDERLIYKVKFSKRIILLDILFSLILFSLAANSGRESIIAFLSMLLFIPLFIKTIIDFYRIFFHHVFITNQRVIYIKGNLLKRIKIYDLNNIIGVYYKSPYVDFKKNVTTFKVNLKNNQTFFIKYVNEGIKVAELLSVYIKKHNRS